MTSDLLKTSPRDVAARCDFDASAAAARTLAALLAPYLGQRLVGVVDGVGCIELVFDGPSGNLLSVWVDKDEKPIGHADGFVANPSTYAATYGVNAERAEAS